MKNFVLLLILIMNMLLFVSGCTNDSLHVQIEEKADIINDLEKTINEKEVEIADLVQELSDSQKGRYIPPLPDGITAKELKQDLFKQTDLIPFDSVLGGIPHYYSEIFLFLSK